MKHLIRMNSARFRALAILGLRVAPTFDIRSELIELNAE
jgi:hypothetical protein